jgi:hypothetical protein
MNERLLCWATLTSTPSRDWLRVIVDRLIELGAPFQVVPIDESGTGRRFEVLVEDVDDNVAELGRSVL